MLDVVIRGGLVYDGTGGKPSTADVGVLGETIAEMGDLRDVPAASVIEAGGLAICPGFIDVHGHSDIALLVQPGAESKLVQGVTTEIVGNCGLSPHPLPPSGSQVRDLLSFIDVERAREWSWKSTGEYLSCLEQASPAINVGALVGGGVLRANVLGTASRAASPAELGKITDGAEQSLAEGALGISTGLIYAPGIYSTPEELQALCKGNRGRRSVYTSHLRGYRGRLFSALEEAIQVGEGTGVSVEISHLKVAGSANWGRAEEVVQVVDRAREAGVDVGFDVYPYLAGNTTLAALLPPWAQVGGIGAVVERLNRSEVRRRLRSEIYSEAGQWENIAEPDRWEDITISSVATASNAAYQGMTVAEAARQRGQSSEDTVMDLLIEENGAVRIINIHLADRDVDCLLGHPSAMIGSDAFTMNVANPMARSAHPRCFGTFPRILGEYVRKRRVLTWEDAIRKMTSLPADKFRLSGRGRIARGAYADVVVFDASQVEDRASYARPAVLPAGIRHVLVNGKIALEGGRLTGTKGGRVLRGGAPA